MRIMTVADVTLYLVYTYNHQIKNSKVYAMNHFIRANNQIFGCCNDNNKTDGIVGKLFESLCLTFVIGH